VLHLIVGALLWLSGGPISKAPEIKPKAVKSYLVYEEPKPVSELPEESQKELTPLEPSKVELKPRKPIPQVPETNTQKANLATTADITKHNRETVLPEKQEPTRIESLPQSPSKSLISASEQYIDERLFPVPSYREQIRRNRQISSQRSTNNASYLPDISGLSEIAQAANGKRLVKYGKNCFSIGQNEFRDALWTPTPCPDSANPMRKQLRESLKKFGVGQ
jgi:hypothetical protein